MMRPTFCTFLIMSHSKKTFNISAAHIAKANSQAIAYKLKFVLILFITITIDVDKLCSISLHLYPFEYCISVSA